MWRRTGGFRGVRQALLPRQAGCGSRGAVAGRTRLLRWLTVTVTLVALIVPGPLPLARLPALAQATTPAPARTAPAAPGSASVLLFPSLPSPQPVGTTILWTAFTTIHAPVYRFGVATAVHGPYQTVRDFSPRPSMLWTRLLEGTYYIQVTAKAGFTATATSSAVAAFTLSPRITGSAASVSPTGNPLVALYSAPACSAGQMEVRFRAQGSGGGWNSTNAEPCVAGQSRNFWVAGMRAQTTYQLVNVMLSGTVALTSAPLAFTTGRPPSAVVFPGISVPQTPGPQSDLSAPLAFHALSNSASISEANPLATDLQGRVVWYTVQSDLGGVSPVRIEQESGQYGDVTYLLGNDGYGSVNDNVLRSVDLAGNPLQETNVQEVNTQLSALGQRIIYGFSHDALQLPNGDTAVLGFTEETITTTPIMGDMLVVLGPSLQVVWTWDAFQHLNPHRGPTLGDTCGFSYPVCPVPGGPGVIDWTHANSVDYSPADGNLILSLRSQDWIIKINYANGSGDGSVLWRMGPQGDFAIVPQSPKEAYPWFSHQHDANYIDSTTLEAFDDGDTRCVKVPPPCDSRGQAYIVDEQSKVVTQTVNVDVGTFSEALGSAQRLSNGNYDFGVGVALNPPPPSGLEVEVLPDGTKVYVQKVNTPEYRTWRLTTLYSTINPPCPSCPS